MRVIWVVKEPSMRKVLSPESAETAHFFYACTRSRFPSLPRWVGLKAVHERMRIMRAQKGRMYDPKR